MSDMDLRESRGWRPAEGDTLIGTVVEVSRNWSDYARAYYPIVTVQSEGENSELIAVHCFHAVLKDRILALRPVVGDRIGIKYVGSRDGKQPGTTVNLYTVRVQGKTNAGDPYAGMAPTPAAPPVPSDVPVNPEDFAQNGPAQTDDDIPF